MVTLAVTALALLAVLGLTLFACASGDASVTEEDSGSEVTVAVGGQLEVALDSSLAGESVWLVSEIDPDVLMQAGESSFEPEEEGSDAGTETFYFEGISEGTTTLKMEYGSPASVDGPERTFEITVHVK